MIQPIHNFDAVDAYFLDKELVAMQQRSFETLTSPLNAELLVPMYTRDDSGASFHQYTMTDNTGKASLITGENNAIKLVNVTRSLQTVPYASYGAGVFMTFENIRQSRMAMLDMAQAKVRAALQRTRLRMNDVAFYGEPEAGITGWLNNPAITPAPVTGGTWATKTADEILDDMHEAVYASVINTDGAVRLENTTLVVPVEQYGIISSKPRGAGTDTTVLEYFLNTHRGVEVFAANELKGAFAGGTDGMISYERNPEYFYQLVSMNFEARPTLQEQNGYLTIYESRLGGVVIVYPESQQMRYGI